jgi:hypothetical protein
LTISAADDCLALDVESLSFLAHGTITTTNLSGIGEGH